MIRTYETPLAMLEAAKESARLHPDTRARDFNSTDGWEGESPATLFALARQGGNENNVPAALKMLSKMEASLPETERAEFLPSVAGAYPCVPDFLLGMPEPMRLKSIVSNMGAPVKLGVITTVSGGCSDQGIRLRGQAMLAILIQLMNSGRAVELWNIAILDRPGDENGEAVIATRVSNGVVSLAEADMVLCNVGFCRRAPFAIQMGMDKSYGGWPRDFQYRDGGAEYAAGLANRMGFQMVLPALINSEEAELRGNPVKWMLGKYNAIQAQINGEA